MAGDLPKWETRGIKVRKLYLSPSARMSFSSGHPPIINNPFKSGFFIFLRAMALIVASLGLAKKKGGVR